MDKMREEFEAWVISCDMCTYCDDGKYRHQSTEWAWESWKASRAALCVELPIQYQAPLVDDPAMDADEVRWALDESGVSYK